MLPSLLLIGSLALSQQVPSRPADAIRPSSAIDTREGLLPDDGELRKRTVPAGVVATARQLESADYAVRRSATSALREGAVALEDLLALLAQGDLEAESHHRLVAIVTDRILSEPYGALGVHMDMGPSRGGPPGVRITGCVAGMPAERHLKPDDVIVAIDGRAVTVPKELTDIVQRIAPGTAVRVEAVRAERDPRGQPRFDAEGRPITTRIDVRFPLGSSRQLEEVAATTLVRMPASAEKREMAEEVLRRYAPQPVVVEMPDDRESMRRFAQLDPDAHPDIQGLKRLLAIASDERRSVDASTMSMLQATLSLLQRQAQDRSYPEAQRDWFRRVAERYAELMPTLE